MEKVLEAYLVTSRVRFPRQDLDHPATPLFVDVRGRALSVDQVKYLIERLYIRAGLRARMRAGALVHALRNTFATSALEACADVVELQTLLGHASVDTTSGTWYEVILARWRSGTICAEAELSSCSGEPLFRAPVIPDRLRLVL